jgi:tetratricopeptide (TPR) repeat protein
MAYPPELPHMPTRLEIYNKAVELKNRELEREGLPTYKLAASEKDIDPKVEAELREGSYWDRARSELMSGYREELEECKRLYLEELGEMKKAIDEYVRILREMGVEPPEWTLPRHELEERVVRLTRERDRYKEEASARLAQLKRVRKELEETKKIIKELQEKLRAPPAPPAPPPPPKPKELTKEEVKRLEDLFRATLYRELGRVPRDAMSDFRVELETVKTLPYEEAAKVIERLALDIAERERAGRVAPPVAPPTVRPPEVAPAPPPTVPPAKPPAAPIEPMPWPRRLASSEIKAFWDAFRYELASAGLNPDDYIEYFNRFRDAWHSDWLAVLRAYHEMVEDIKAGRPPRVYPRPPTPVPWKKLPEDAVLHFLWLQVARDMDELIGLLNMNGVYVSPQEVTLIVKNEWKKGEQMDSWLKFTPREYLKKILGVDPADP